jgi:hypothetical protein
LGGLEIWLAPAIVDPHGSLFAGERGPIKVCQLGSYRNDAAPATKPADRKQRFGPTRNRPKNRLIAPWQKIFIKPWV